MLNKKNRSKIKTKNNTKNKKKFNKNKKKFNKNKKKFNKNKKKFSKNNKINKSMKNKIDETKEIL